MPTLDANCLFAQFALFAFLIERDPFDSQSGFDKIVINSALPFFDSIRLMFVARFREVDVSMLEKELNGNGFSSDQREFIKRWIHREIDLSRIPVPVSI